MIKESKNKSNSFYPLYIYLKFVSNRIFSRRIIHKLNKRVKIQGCAKTWKTVKVTYTKINIL